MNWFFGKTNRIGKTLPSFIKEKKEQNSKIRDVQKGA